MLADNNIELLTPNVLYFDEKPPPEIFKTKKLSAVRKHTQRKSQNKMKIFMKTVLQQENVLERELKQNLQTTSTYDPLNTTKLEIKYENESEDEAEENKRWMVMDDKRESYDNHLGGECESKIEIDDHFIEEEEEKEGNNEDEPLIMLKRRKGRPRKYPLKTDDNDEQQIKFPRTVVCREICRQRCTEKFDDEQRHRICSYYWSLSKDDKLAFMRKHTKSKRLTRLKRQRTKTRGNNCCYYLRDYSNDDDDDDNNSEEKLIRVCRKFFEATLCVTNHFVKKSIEGCVLEIEKDMQAMNELKSISVEQKNETENLQYLDPETGNLFTINEKVNKSLLKPREPKEKRIRRKPGDPKPQHFPKPIQCAQRCIHKCHTKFTEEERKQICDAFWSMDYKRRKDFILANIEIKDVETQLTPDFRKTNRPNRSYHTRFFLRSSGVRAEKQRVCKHFYVNTLCIHRYFITNAMEFADKTTGSYTGTDRRGCRTPQNKITAECRQNVLDHINSYPIWMPNKKSKTKYLHYSLSIKKMYMDYKNKCLAEQQKYVSTNYYYKTFHDDFRLSFLSNPQPKKGGGFLKINPNISHYTGEETGGCWFDSQGNKLNLNVFNPGESIHNMRFVKSFPAERESQSSNEVVTVQNQHQLFNILRTPPVPSLAAKSIGHQSALNIIQSDTHAPNEQSFNVSATMLRTFPF